MSIAKDDGQQRREHRVISAYGEVRIVGQERSSSKHRASRASRNRQGNNRQAKAPADPQAEFGKLVRQLSRQMAPWREEWNWAKIRRLEERIDRLVEERPRAGSR